MRVLKGSVLVRVPAAAACAQFWINNYTPMDNGAGLAKQCEVAKARNPKIRCVVYRNTVIALNQVHAAITCHRPPPRPCLALLRAALRLDRNLPSVLPWCGALT